MLYGRLDPVTGRLTDMGGTQASDPNAVPVAVQPAGFGPWTYDAVNQLAVPVPPRKPRTMYAIATDIFALTGSLPTPAAGTQKAHIITDLFGGSPPKYQLDAGPNTAAISAVYAAITAPNGFATFNAAQQLIIAAMYAQDNPNYLVNPAFDPTINVPGDQLA